MKAAVLFEPNMPLQIEEVTLQAPKANEVLVRIAASGVCRSDHHLMTGATQHPLPVVLGHEGAGVVEAVGPGVTRAQPGDHVVLSWVPVCGDCFYCSNGLPAQCDTSIEPLWGGVMLDGTSRLSIGEQTIYHYTALATFAEQVVVPESCCVPIRKEVPLKVAALIGCAVTTGVGAVVRRARVTPGSSVAVFGCGGVGLNVVQAAALSGAVPIIAVDISSDKLAMAERFGATYLLDASGESLDAVEAIHALTGGRGADYTFEAIGLPPVMKQAVDAARRGGTIVLVGLGPHGDKIELGAGTFTRSDKVLTSAYYGMTDPMRDMPTFLEWYLNGMLKLDELITHTFALDDVNKAFDAMQSGEAVRSVIVFD
jgi:S-(hydroxymethyl)glutathione dehydrogenase/alcohol dehydrogenase